MTSLRRAIPLLAIIFTTATALGQAATPPPDHVMTLSAYGGYQFSSSYDKADVSIARSGVNFEDTRIFNPRWIFNGTVLFEDSYYDFNNFGKEVPGNKNPVDNAMMLQTLPTLTYVYDPKWSFTVGGIAQLAGQNSAMFDQAFTYGGLAIVHYRVSPNLTIGGGYAWYTRLEQSSTFSPVLAIDWKINDKWNFSAKGWTAKLNYVIDDGLVAYLGAAYEWRQFRLVDSDPGAFSSGVLTDSDVPVKVGIQWQAFPQITVSGEIGAILDEQITFDDKDGNRQTKHTLNPTPYFGMRVDYKF